MDVKYDVFSKQISLLSGWKRIIKRISLSFSDLSIFFFCAQSEINADYKYAEAVATSSSWTLRHRRCASHDQRTHYSSLPTLLTRPIRDNCTGIILFRRRNNTHTKSRFRRRPFVIIPPCVPDGEEKLEKMITPRGNTTIPHTRIYVLADNESHPMRTRGTHSFPSELEERKLERS